MKGKLTTRLLLFGCLMALSVSSVLAVPIEVLDHPELLANTKPDNQPVSDISDINALYKTGDSVYFLCLEKVFQFNTFGGTDCWGWRGPDGTEYAIMGIDLGVVFVNTATMEIVDTVIGPQSGCGGTRWRDMKTYQNYCYAVSECSGTNQGMLVIDLQYLPDSVHYVKSVDVSNTGLVTSHNLSIDTINGYAYLEGTSSVNFNVHIHNLADPANPVYSNSFGTGGASIHDIYAIDDTVYVADGANPNLSIWDVSNKLLPQLMTRWSIPNPGYVHNIWPSDDRRHVATTEETAGKTIKIWNIEDYQNVQLVGEIIAPSGLAHNAQVRGDTAYMSHYESGVVAIDFADPVNPAIIGSYDTYSTDNSNFNGAWGCYPYTSNGLIYGSNLDGRLFILSENNIVIGDTMIALDALALPGTQVKVDIWAKFDLPIRRFEVPFNWGGPYNLTFDSVSTQGLMTEYFEIQDFTAYDPFFKRACYGITSSTIGTSPDLPEGEGVILSLFFSIPGGAMGDSNLITFTPFSGKEPTFTTACIAYNPDTLSGSITLGDPPCCVGIRGNVDGIGGEPGIDIADVLYMVDYQFGTPAGPAPVCPEEGDVDGVGGTDIADLLYLVDYSFGAPPGPAPVSCP